VFSLHKKKLTLQVKKTAEISSETTSEYSKWWCQVIMASPANSSGNSPAKGKNSNWVQFGEEEAERESSPDNLGSSGSGLGGLGGGAASSSGVSSARGSVNSIREANRMKATASIDDDDDDDEGDGGGGGGAAFDVTDVEVIQLVLLLDEVKHVDFIIENANNNLYLSLSV
jgi:hypothetical protein